MTEGPFAVILVLSTSHALHLEGLLGEKGVACKLIPVPRQLSSDCGVCLRIARGHVEEARGVVVAARMEIQGIVDVS